MNATRLYQDQMDSKLENFLIEQINSKWSEEMPVLYELCIFVQDEMMEQYFEEEGFPDEKDESGVPMIEMRFADAQTA